MRMAPLIFRQRTFQTVRIDRQITDVFTDDGTESNESVSNRREQILVNWLASDPAARDLLCDVLQRSPHAFIGTEVKAPFYGHSEGDIDLMICDPAMPHETAVLECKRVKVEVIDEANDAINKLDEVGKGVQQTKKLYEKFSFFQTYLAVISAIDAAKRKQINIPCRGVTSESVPNWDTTKTSFRSIVEFPRREELPCEIGIIFIELVQPSGRKFEDQGTIRICVHHPATPRCQRAADTNKVGTLIG